MLKRAFILCPWKTVASKCINQIALKIGPRYSVSAENTLLSTPCLEISPDLRDGMARHGNQVSSHLWKMEHHLDKCPRKNYVFCYFPRRLCFFLNSLCHYICSLVSLTAGLSNRPSSHVSLRFLSSKSTFQQRLSLMVVFTTRCKRNTVYLYIYIYLQYRIVSHWHTYRILIILT